MPRRWHIKSLDIYPFNYTSHEDALIRESGMARLVQFVCVGKLVRVAVVCVHVRLPMSHG